MIISLYDRRGEVIADTFDAHDVRTPKVGDFIRKAHPPGAEMRVWHVIAIEHDFAEGSCQTRITAWETTEKDVQTDKEARHYAHQGTL